MRSLVTSTVNGIVWLCLLPLASCAGWADARSGATRPARVTDSGFAGVQERGALVMGVDQSTSTHHFTPNEAGGLILLQRDSVDEAGIARIRSHMRGIAAAFAAGDFTLPGVVHAQVVPGTEVMRARREHITYSVEDLSRGAQVRMVTRDSAARRAIEAFLAFQRQDHHAGMRHD